MQPTGEGVTLTWRRVSPCRVLISRKTSREMLSMAAVSSLNVISPSSAVQHGNSGRPICSPSLVLPSLLDLHTVG